MPYHLAPTQPGLFTLANSFFSDPSAFVPASPGSWILTAPTVGVPPTTLTIQGLIEVQPVS